MYVWVLSSPGIVKIWTWRSTVQEMLRHAKVQTTLDLYTQGNNDNKISAQDRFCGAWPIHSM
jgi:hypothetical protein